MIKDDAGNRRFYGVYRGVVIETNDPLNLGRVRLQIPQVLLTEETGWCWAVASPGVIQVLPNVGDGVWVMFEGGDPSYPIFIGSFNPMKLVYGSFDDFTNQTAALANTGYTMKLGNTEFSHGVHVVGGTKITFDVAGVYNLIWSGQFVNPTANSEDAQIWLRQNGVDVAGSTGVVAVLAKHGATDGHNIAGWNFMFSAKPTDYFELIWATTNASVSLSSLPPVASPPVPSSPSVAVTIQQVN